MKTKNKIEFKIGDKVVFKNKWGYTTSGPIIKFIDMPTYGLERKELPV